MENGIETTRARTTRFRRTFSMSIDLMGEDDKLALDGFMRDMKTGAAGGALPFLISDPRYQANPQTYLVRFASLPKYVDAGWIAADPLTPAGYRFNCTFQVREI